MAVTFKDLQSAAHAQVEWLKGQLNDKSIVNPFVNTDDDDDDDDDATSSKKSAPELVPRLIEYSEGGERVVGCTQRQAVLSRGWSAGLTFQWETEGDNNPALQTYQIVSINDTNITLKGPADVFYEFADTII